MKIRQAKKIRYQYMALQLAEVKQGWWQFWEMLHSVDQYRRATNRVMRWERNRNRAR